VGDLKAAAAVHRGVWPLHCGILHRRMQRPGLQVLAAASSSARVLVQGIPVPAGTPDLAHSPADTWHGCLAVFMSSEARAVDECWCNVMSRLDTSYSSLGH
jgi:hypothetical protein